MADVRVMCDTPEHDDIRRTAYLAIGLYPIGILASNTVLLILARRAIMSKRPTKLSKSLGFLHREYEPGFFWWELMEMLRRFVLVGVLVIAPYERGSLPQMGLATVIAICYLFVQQHAAPFRNRVDDYVANVVRAQRHLANALLRCALCRTDAR